MPWSVKKMGGTFCVVKEGETSSIKGGCHDSKSEAAAHVRALYASEAEHAVSELYETDIEEEVDMDEFGAGDNFEFSDSMKEHPWTGPIVFENVYTGDNRVFKSDSINWQEDTLPWAFRWQKASSQGHAGSVPVGRVDRLERKEDGSIVGFGVVIPELSDEAEQYYKLLKSGAGGGVSVDGDSAQFEIQEEEGSQPKVEFSSMRLRALSAVDIPAFNGARIHLIEDEEEVSTDEVSLEVTDLQEELADKKPFPFEKKEEKDEDAEEKDSEEEDEEEDSEDSENSEDAEDKDEEDKDKKKFPFQKKVAADLDLREELAKKKRKKKKMSYGWQIDEALTAAAIPVLPSTDSFIDPVFDGPTPLSVTPDGKVFGHLALFNTCHIGFPGTCVKPPKGSKYQYFHTGQIETAEGDLVEVGKLTFKTGHASMSSNPRVAAEHYDNTGAVAADVRAGEDKFGIWVTGALRPHLTDQDIREFRAAPLSGDWRRIAGKLELVGALSVNVPGFPVPRVRAMVASGETEALITFLADDDEEFTFSYEELDTRVGRKMDLAAKVSEFLGEEIDMEAPEGEIPDDIPDAPTKAEIEARAETYTQNDFFEDLKALRELLDSNEKMPAKVRSTLETLYAAAIKTDDGGKRTTYSGYDLDIIENSGLTIEEWTTELELSGLDIQEFYNQCHDGDGRFCEGVDGPGRVRDNVKGKHFIPGTPHGKDHPGHSTGSPSGGTSSSGGSGSGGSGSGGGGTPGGGGGSPGGGGGGSPFGGGGGGVNPRVYESYITTRSRARGWGAAATIAALALHSPASPFLAGLATAGGVGILANPAVLTLAFVTGVTYAGKNIISSRKHRAEYNRSVQRKLKTDRLNERQQRERDRLRTTT